METPPQDAPLSAVPGLPDDDLPNTVTVPPGALAPLPPDQYAELLAALRGYERVMDGAFARLPDQVEALFDRVLARLVSPAAQLTPVDASALEHLCEALDGLKAGATILGAPYHCTMQALTPQGYPVAVTIQRQDGAAFFEAVTGMAGWFQAQGYMTPPAAVAF